MSIRTRTMLYIGGTLLLLLLLLSVTSYLVLTASLKAQEDALAARTLDQLHAVIDDHSKSIARTVTDWAVWDSMDAYARRSQSQPWPELDEATLVNLDCTLFYIAENTGHTRFARTIDLQHARTHPISAAMGARITDVLARLQVTPEHPVSGLLDLPDGPAIFAAVSILPSSRRGPAHGVLLMARHFDAAQMQHLGRTSGLAVTITRPSRTVQVSSSQPMVYERRSPHVLVAHALLTDVFGAPCCVISASMPRTMFHSGLRAIYLAITLLCVIGCLTGVLVLVLLERLVLKRVVKLGRAVTAAGTDTAARVPLEEMHDELHRLAVSINSTLDARQAAQAQAAMRESEERLRTLFYEIAAVMLVIDPATGAIADANPAACAFYGYPRETLCTMRIQQINTLPQEDVSRLLRDAAEGGQRHFDFHHRLASGEVRDVEVDSSRINFGNRILLCSIVQDVTARKQIEQALEQERATLTAAQETLTIPLTIVSADYTRAQRNQAEIHYLGSLGVTDLAEAEMLDPDTRVPVTADARPVQRALRGESLTAVPYILVAPNGVQRDILVYAAPIFLNGQIVAAVRVVDDVTALREADRAKDEFLAVLSHELQTPLTSILGWTDLALAGDGSLYRQALDVVLRNAHRQERLVKDMLDMSRLLHRKLHLSRSQTDLAEEVRNAVESLAQTIDSWGGTLRVVCDDTPLTIFADGVRLQQCITNLLLNAIKFTPGDGCITLHCLREEAQAVLEVADTGRGIDPRDLPVVFTAFQQVERDERAGGLGLGLALVRGIVALHGGTVTADSPGCFQGCTFRVRLPLAAESASDAGKCLSAVE
jgi:PAS domain S-box-containing protein